MKITGKLFAGQNPTGIDIEIELGDNGFLYSPQFPGPVLLSQVVISSRIGNTPRRLVLPSGAAVETLQNEALDAWLRNQGTHRGLLHRLESNLKFALSAVAIVALFFTWFAVWGIPWLSTRAAYAIPADVNNYIARGTLETLDNRIFKNSSLDPPRQAELSSRFNALVPAGDGVINYRLVFRGGGLIGPNAFALPDGTVVITDELILLAKDDDEIMSVLLHEIGHVVYRHSLRKVISHSSLIALTSIITGDLNSAGSLVLTMPNILVDSSYSRELEFQADSYSLEHLPQLGIRPAKFADFMQRLEACARFLVRDNRDEATDQPVTYLDCEAFASKQQAPVNNDDNWIDYISSHPPGADRISRFREAKQSVTIAD